MSNLKTLISAVLILSAIAPAAADRNSAERPLDKQDKKAVVIAHRGASGYLPEHTLAAYAIAILQGADFIEPDLVMTKDGHLIARHDNVLDLTTNVADRPEFASRKTIKMVDGVSIEGWFSEDFTLEEIKTLRAIERIPDTRPANARFDGQFEIPTLREVIDLVQAAERALGRKIGIYPETKHPTYFDGLNLSLEEPLVEILHKSGYRGPKALVFIQSFEITNLKDMREMTKLPLVQLLDTEGQPFDVVAARGGLTYERMATAEGLAEIATYANAVGPEKYTYIIPRDGNGNLDLNNQTDFVANAHAAGLKVHPYTFRAENTFLPANLKSGNDPNALGNSESEIKIFLQAGIDGFFIDQPDIGVAARNVFVERE